MIVIVLSIPHRYVTSNKVQKVNSMLLDDSKKAKSDKKIKQAPSQLNK